MIINNTTPNYYKHNGVECIDVIDMILGKETGNNFCLANIIKYLFRFKEKNGIEDLCKLRDYADMYIKRNS